MFLSTWPHMQNMFLNPWRQIHAPIQKLSRFPHRKQTILWTQRLVLAAVKALAIRVMLGSALTNWTHHTCASRDQDVSHHINAGRLLLNKLSHGPAHRGFSNRGKEIGKSLLPSGVGAAAAASPSRPGFASSETSASSICKFPDI